jgi:hypothetical protein
MRQAATKQFARQKDGFTLPANGVAFESIGAAVLPPLLGILTALLSGIPWEGATESAIAQVLMPLMIGGTVILSAVVILDCRAAETLSPIQVADFRGMLVMSVSFTLTFLAVWLTAEAERNGVSTQAEFVIFVCLPVLFVSTSLLWLAARSLKRTAARLLMLTGFLAATIIVELHALNGEARSGEEEFMLLHSLLIALALAIWLCTWGHRQFRQPEDSGT